MTKTVYGEVVLRETGVDITEPTRLRRAARCATN